MVKVLVLQKDDRLKEININNIKDLDDFILDKQILSKYKYDNETIFLFNSKHNNDIRFNLDQVPHYFNLRYLNGDIFFVCINNDNGELEDFDIEDYSNILNGYETDYEDEESIKTETDSRDSDDEYDFNDGFLVNDSDIE